MQDFRGKNLYIILGIDEEADEAEIKAAYRRLARKYHPDTNKGNKNSEIMFKEVAQAYEILGNKQKRAEYDRINGYNQKKEESKTTRLNEEGAKKAYQKQSSTTEQKTEPPPKPKQETKKQEQNKESFADFFNGIFKQKNNEKIPIKGTDINVDLTITINEAQNGTVRRVNVVHTQSCSHCHGKKFINQAKCPKCLGEGEIITHKKILVKIPANVKQNDTVIIEGEGNIGENGGKNGNLQLKIKIEKSEMFKFDGLNVLSEIPISPTEAALGASIVVPTIDGHMTMKIPPETSSNQKFKLAGQGIYDDNGKIRGDHIVTVYIKMPKNLSDEEKDFYLKLSKLREYNPRKGN